MRTHPAGGGDGPWSRAAGMWPAELGASIALLAVLAAAAVAGLLLDANRPKALRVGLASATYIGALLGGTALSGSAGPRASAPSFRLFALAGGCAGLVSGLVRPSVAVPVVAVQALAGAFLLGGFHWWAVCSWRRVHERIAGGRRG